MGSIEVNDSRAYASKKVFEVIIGHRVLSTYMSGTMDIVFLIENDLASKSLYDHIENIS